MNKDQVLKSLKASAEWSEATSYDEGGEFVVSAEVWLWSGGGDKGSWHFVTLPEDMAAEILESYGQTHASRNGLIRVEAKVGKTAWQTSLLKHNPSKSYLIALKAAVRKAESITAGEMLTLRFKVIPFGK